MNVEFTLQGITFEWDDDKARLNRSKHGVSFEKACEAFLDPFFRVVDAGVIEGERREAIIGLAVDWRLLFVVYVVRQEAVRIISARPATEKERREYENQ